MRPVAGIMYIDFTPLAIDQIANQGAKNRYMFGGKTTVPMVVRTEGGARRNSSTGLTPRWCTCVLSTCR
jgi:pyruvate/2-oxoglutarate/acetoin dehydrogenase E1 component